MKGFTRLDFFFIFIVLLVLFISARLFYLQIIKGVYYRKEAAAQYIYKTGDNFNRGSIYFSSKNDFFIPAAQMSSQYDIAIDPRIINLNLKNLGEKAKKEKYEEFYQKLENIFTKFNLTNSSSTENFISKELFFIKISKIDSAYEVIKQGVNQDLANNLTEAHIKGLIIQRKRSRHYPESYNASKVLGFVGYAKDQIEKIGLYGLEKYYDDVLNRNNVKGGVNFFAEVFADLGQDMEQNSTLPILDSDKSGDLNLTIDIDVQRFLHKTLLALKSKWKSENLGGIIMDPNTGAIFAMDELPSFDPNNYNNVANIKLYNNDLVSGVYEMGSILKPLTIAAALDSGVIDENTTYHDNGIVEINGFKISNYDKKARGINTSIQTILDKSLNVGIAFVVQRMGKQTLSKYFHKYGFGRETGVDLPGEVPGLVNNLDSNVTVDSVTAGFGQGIAVTPIGTIRALAALGNGGKLVNPHVVESISLSSGEVIKNIPNEGEKVFEQASTSKIISEMLVHVVDVGMDNKNPNYTIAAKTGTAQIPDPSTHKYSKDKYLHSFFGYFPAYKPRYIIFIYQINPIGAEYASQTLKDSFFKIVDFLISYYEVSPDR